MTTAVDTDTGASDSPAAPERLGLTASRLQEVGAVVFFRARQAASLGLGSTDLCRLVETGTIERVARGLYRLTAAEPTEHYTIAAVCARVPDAIVCLLSALSVHELGTPLPREVWIAVPHKARAPRLPEFPIKVVRFSGAALRYGVETIRLEGVPVHITNPARTVVDCFRFRRLVGQEVARETLRFALQERRVTAEQVWRAADVCHARSLLRPVLEVLTG